MKKILMLCVAVMMAATSMKAQHEIGGIVGGMNGLSYKYWFNDAWALQADLAVGLTQAAGSEYGISWSEGMYDFTINPNALYHFELPANFKIYVGGGIKFGMANYLKGGSNQSLMGKFGINATAGATYDIQSVPLVLALDFRPGYGLGFRDQGYTLNFFDWNLAFAVRYKL